MNPQMTASRATQHCAEMHRSAEAARRAKLARAARVTAPKPAPVERLPRLRGWLVTSHKSTAVPAVARPRTV